MKRDTAWFIAKAKTVHGDKYDYRKAEYVSMDDKVRIVHKGDIYLQTPHDHLHGYCPEERTDLIGQIFDTDSFISMAEKINPDRYTYNKTTYITATIPLLVTCQEHGDFNVTPKQFICRHTQCPSCAIHTPEGKSELLEYVNGLAKDTRHTVIENDRLLLGGLELDIYIPSLDLAIDFNGNLAHSDIYKDELYHQYKYTQCTVKGVRLIQIWEHQWSCQLKRSIIKSIIQHQMGLSERIFARNCELKSVKYSDTTFFCQTNHLQGRVPIGSKMINNGLYHNNELVGVISAIEPSTAEAGYVSRVCWKQGVAVIGGHSKLTESLPNGEYSTHLNLDLGAASRLYKYAYNISMTVPSWKWSKDMMTLSSHITKKENLHRIYKHYDGSIPVDRFMRENKWCKLHDAGTLKLFFKV